MKPPSAAALFAHQHLLEEARLEVWLARLAVPAALLIAWVLAKMDLGRFLLRIIFSGGAGSLVFGAALMAAFFVPPHHKLHRDWLRWGFLVIGAAGFVDTFEQWWTARTDLSVVGIGDEIEGVGFTDTTRLMETYGWTARAMVSRYFGLGVLCLLILGTLQVLQVRRTREALEALEAEVEPHRRSA